MRVRPRVHCFALASVSELKSPGKSRREFTKKVLEEVAIGLHQKEPESMLGEKSCVESLAKDDRVKVRDHQEDVDENNPAPRRVWKE